MAVVNNSASSIAGRLLDLVTLGALITWPFIYAFGTFAAWMAALGFATAGEAIRLASGRTSIARSSARRLRALWHAEGTTWVLGVVLVTRLAVLGVGALTTLTVDMPDDKPMLAGPRLWSMQARWDGFWYLDIAANGYAWDPGLETQQNVAFFPAYPLLMRVTGETVTIPAHVLRDPDLLGTFGLTRVLLGGTLASLLAFTVALLLLYRLARQDLAAGHARAAVLIAACMPFGVFFSATYTESLFMLGLVGSFLAMRRGKYGAALTCGILVGLTRPNGLMACVPLAVAALERRRHADSSRRAGLPAALAVIGPALGAGVQMAYLWSAFGDPFAWSAAQADWGRTAGVTTLVSSRWENVTVAGPLSYVQTHPLEIANTLMLLCALWLAWRARRLAWSYALLVFCLLAPAVLIGLPALGRMTAPLFPVPLALAIVLPAQARWPAAVLLLAGQLGLAALFYAWQPVT